MIASNTYSSSDHRFDDSDNFTPERGLIGPSVSIRTMPYGNDGGDGGQPTAVSFSGIQESCSIGSVVEVVVMYLLYYAYIKNFGCL